MTNNISLTSNHMRDLIQHGGHKDGIGPLPGVAGAPGLELKADT